MNHNSSNTSPATSAAHQTQQHYTPTPTPIVSVAAHLDPETQRDVTIKLTLASMSAQQGRGEEARYWTDRAAQSLAEYRQSQTAG